MGEDQTALLNTILEDINIKINIPTARELIDLHKEFNTDNYAPNRDEIRDAISKRLIAPPYYNNSKKNAGLKSRAGEPELRQLYINNIIKNTKYKYSVETQTEKPHNFTNNDSDGRSGNIDLTIYSPESKKDNLKKSKLVNIEFKFYSLPKEELKRDITKLVFEEINGILYLSKTNSNKSTIPKILEKLYEVFLPLKEFKSKDKDFQEITDNKLVMIFIVVLEKMNIYHKVFDFNEAKDNFDKYCKDFFVQSNFPALKISEIKK